MMITMIMGCALTVVLLLISVIDYCTFTIPNWVLLALFLPVSISFALPDAPQLLSRIIGLLVISLPMYLLTLCRYDCFGEGDIKMIAICGFLLGVQNTLVAAFIAVIIGGVWGLMILALQRQKYSKHIPFGPCLSVGIFTAYLFGDRIVQIYLTLCG